MKLIFALNCWLLVAAAIVPSTWAQSQYPYSVPRIERVTRINLEQLRLGRGAYPETAVYERLRAEFAYSKAAEFFQRADTERTCAGSEMRSGFECLELKNTQVGYRKYQEPSIYLPSDGYFQPFDRLYPYTQIYVDRGRGEFFIHPVPPEEAVLGPFRGDPVVELTKAAFPSKERNTFPGVRFLYVSKRWRFPNERDAMLDRGSDRYDYAGGMPSGREMEKERLRSQFFRFRIENKSGKQLFLLYHNDIPEVFHLQRHESWTGWSRDTQPKFNGMTWPTVQWLNWVSLPDTSAIEFETRAGCDLKMTCAVGIYLNDERRLWDEVELIAVYPSEKPREFSRKNSPPPR